MTAKQFQKKVSIARKYGSANMGNGCILIFTGFYWAIRKGRETVDTASTPDMLKYLFD